MLQIKDLSISVGQKNIVRGIQLSLLPHSIHVIIGANGSGKSSLLQAIMGHPHYQIVKGAIHLNEEEIHELSPDQRSKRGFFLAFQHPQTIPGLSYYTFLKESYHVLVSRDEGQFMDDLQEAMEELMLDFAMLERGVNEGFSGGEKKKFELLHLLLLKPTCLLIDELDSGLDAHSIDHYIHVLQRLYTQKKERCILLVSHNREVIERINPQALYFMAGGQIIKSAYSTAEQQRMLDEMFS